MKARKSAIIIAVNVVLALLLLVQVTLARADEEQLLEGLTPVVAAYCVDNHWILYPCVKYIKKGEAGFYLAILSADASEVLYILRIEGAVQTLVWQKGLLL